jgi:catechol 2,3-dioxygenase-like lactoylglutathione lyase family enzyme
VTFCIRMLFHSTHLVGNLDQAEAWYERVFQRPGIKWSERWDLSMIAPGFPTDYSSWVFMGDLVHDLVSPERYRRGMGGGVVPGLGYGQRDGLGNISFWVVGSSAFAEDMLKKGVKLINQQGVPLVDASLPVSAHSPEFTVMGTEAAETGIPILFSEALPLIVPKMSNADPRLRADWVVPAASPDDPLTIERCAYHSVIVSGGSPLQAFLTTTLGGEVISSSKTESYDMGQSTFVYLADTVIELISIPEAGRKEDEIVGITMKVADLNAAKQHLTRMGIGLVVETDRLLVTNPDDCLGVRWGFTSSLPENDPRI